MYLFVIYITNPTLSLNIYLLLSVLDFFLISDKGFLFSLNVCECVSECMYSCEVQLQLIA